MAVRSTGRTFRAWQELSSRDVGSVFSATAPYVTAFGEELMLLLASDLAAPGEGFSDILSAADAAVAGVLALTSAGA